MEKEKDKVPMSRTEATDLAKRIIENSGYGNHGAGFNKNSTRGWFADSRSHKEDIEDNLGVLRERARDLYMGSPLGTGAIKTMRTNCVGTGLKLKSTPDAEILKLDAKSAQTLARTIEREFALWAESTDCDLQRIDTFVELQQLVFLNWLMSGDVLVTLPSKKRTNMPYDMRINLIEGDRVYTPPDKIGDESIIEGVERDQTGEVVAYYIARKHPGSTAFLTHNEFDRVEAYGKRTGRRNVLHIMNRERIGQCRGVPFLTPIMEPVKQISRYTDAEIMAAVINGMYAVFIEREKIEGVPIGTIADDLQVTNDEKTMEIGNGSIVELRPGEKANLVTPGRPNPNFESFIKAICQQIGSALEIPPEVLLKQYSASYSASRGALLEFYKSVNMHRNWLVMDFCQPVFEEFMAEAVAKGRIYAPGFFRDPIIKKAYCSAKWYGPSNGQLDPKKEVEAAEKRVANGFSTREKETVELTGGNFYENVAKIKEENRLLNAAKGGERIGKRS